eukprot:m.48360 g.48360  ORF g.48360 m.48360 type:complete len:296 (+) comp15259_c0_seq3:355-1242(+)
MVGGAYTDGNFLVRPRPQKDGDYIISVVFKGKPTHHLATPGGSGSGGELIVNKTTFGESTIEGLVQKLAKKQPGWPAPLTKPCAPKTRVQKKAHAKSEPVSKPDVPEPKPAEPEPAPIPPEPKETAPEPEPQPEEPVRASTPPPAEPAAEVQSVQPTEEAPNDPEALPALPPPREIIADVAPPTTPPSTSTVPEDLGGSPPLPPRNRNIQGNAEATNGKSMPTRRQVDLRGLEQSSTTAPTLSLMSTPALTSTPTDGPELTYMLARAVLRLGTRVSAAEMQLQETRQLLHSLQSL